MKYFILVFSLGCILLLSSCSSPSVNAVPEGPWEYVETDGLPVARHEAAFVKFQDKFYLMGGRGLKPVNVYDPATNKWADQSAPPIEFHHFQPVVYNEKIYMICAMTGPFPKETGLPNVIIYDPIADKWETGDEIPEDRRRGGAGVVLHNEKFYIVSGIVNGHMGGYVNWADEYDPKTGAWRRLPDAPHARDHFQAAIVGGKIYAAGGRRTSKETNQVFHLVVPEVDVFDLASETWTSLPSPELDLPTPRAGTSTMELNGELLVIGGETVRKSPAHNEVEAYNPSLLKWSTWPHLVRGRHGTGVVLHNNYIWTCSGSGNRGGGPELTSTERLKIN